MLVAALALAFFLGAVHAMSPGHGKALVGAYLVGTRGRPSDAVVLGLIVTFSHVFSVLLLGVASLASSAGRPIGSLGSGFWDTMLKWG